MLQARVRDLLAHEVQLFQLRKSLEVLQPGVRDEFHLRVKLLSEFRGKTEGSSAS